MANEFRDLLVEKFKDSKVETFYWDFHRLISLLQMPLRGHLWKRN